ncbi:hypothetical protein Hdeb2414_s0040g00736231 [Helianthus debilis subsp. tardiflorus]
MLKKRFSEIMMQLRIKATKLAYKAGENVKLRNSNQFNIIHKYPPESVPINIWRDICSAWYTKAWLSKSKCGSPNRNIANINGRSSRHTGGSMGFDEHLENWRRTYGREPTWKELFLQTHLTKECKEKLRKWVGGGGVGDLEAMHDIHGSDLTHSPDDPEVCARVPAGGHRTPGYLG